MRFLLVILAALFVSVLGQGAKVVDVDKEGKFSHAELHYPRGKYGSLNAVSIFHYQKLSLSPYM